MKKQLWLFILGMSGISFIFCTSKNEHGVRKVLSDQEIRPLSSKSQEYVDTKWNPVDTKSRSFLSRSTGSIDGARVQEHYPPHIKNMLKKKLHKSSEE